MSNKIEHKLVNLLVEGLYHNYRAFEITTVESCTAGMIAAKIANVPGASNTLKQAYVTYCDEAKENLVGVKAETIKKFSVVSEEVAKEMAEGGLKAANAAVAISVTGFAGKSNISGVADNTVCIGIAIDNICGKSETRTYTFIFKGKRNKVRQQAANKALRLAYLTINEFLGRGQANISSRRLKANKGQNKPNKTKCKKHTVTIVGNSNDLICGGDININSSTKHKTKWSANKCIVNGERVRLPYDYNSLNMVNGDVYIDGKLYYRQGIGYIDDLDETEKQIENTKQKLTTSLNQSRQTQMDLDRFEKSMEQMSKNLEELFKNIN